MSSKVVGVGRFANLLSLKPSTIVHVADNHLIDFRGAREVGMCTVRLRHLDPPSEEHAPHVTITSPEMLPGLLLLGERKDHLNARLLTTRRSTRERDSRTAGLRVAWSLCWRKSRRIVNKLQELD